ncbi:unannotated protein [freshwater metagenome]|uniref:Unannotated protein n=1 Tax=freshwater metagenome TaxID=449393 RepID=A0A6J6LS12_9ZZZZ
MSGIDGGAIKIVVIDASGIADIDYSGGQMMLELVEQLAERDVRMVIANAPADVRREFIIYGVADLLGENSNFETVSSALRAFRNN